MGVSKVDYNGETLIDLTGDTVTPETLAEGATAHDMAGNPITGTMKQGSGGEAVQEIEYVHCTLDLSTMSITAISHTNQQLRNLINANKQCVLICSTPFGPVYGSLAHMDVQSNDVQFSIMLYANMGQGFNLYYFHMFVHANDTVELTTKLISLIG